MDAEAVLVGRKARMLHAMPEMKAAQDHMLDFICGTMGLIFLYGQWSTCARRTLCFRGSTFRQ